MNKHDVMKTLAAARPVRLDPARTPPLPVLGRDAPARRRWSPLLVPAGALAGAAAAVVAVLTIGSNPSPVLDKPVPPTALEKPGPPAASRILLAAAERSSQEPAGGRRYLVLRTETGSVITVGSGAATYEMTARWSFETWLSRSGRERSWSTSRKLGMAPLTPADEAAWRAAGSPTSVPVGKPLPTGALGPAHPVGIAGEPPRSAWSDGSEIYALGNTNVSLAELEKLPTEPAALRAALLGHYDGGGGDLPTDRDEWLLSVASGLVGEIPVSGPVRAAAFRLIADLPGVRSLGVVADQRGREGEGFAFTSENAVGGAIEHRYVIDPASGRALGQESRVLRPAGTTARREPGSLLSYSVVLEQRTTDESPR